MKIYCLKLDFFKSKIIVIPFTPPLDRSGPQMKFETGDLKNMSSIINQIQLTSSLDRASLPHNFSKLVKYEYNSLVSIIGILLYANHLTVARCNLDISLCMACLCRIFLAACESSPFQVC